MTYLIEAIYDRVLQWKLMTEKFVKQVLMVVLSLMKQYKQKILKINVLKKMTKIKHSILKTHTEKASTNV